MRRLLIVLAVCAVLVLGVVAAVVIHRLQGEGNIRGSSTEEFTLPTTPAPKPPPLGTPWPQYGFDETRDRSVQLALRPPVSESLDVRRRQPRRVSAVDRLRAPLLLDELRQVRGGEHEDRQARVEVPLAPLRRRVAGGRAVQARHRVRGLPEQAAVQRPAPEGRRQGDRVRRGLREDPLAEDDRAVRELAASDRQPALRRGLGRSGLGARCAHRPHDLAAQACAGCDQGRDLVDGGQALRRLLRRPRLLPRRAERQAGLEGEGAAPALRRRALLLDAGARLRARVHRRDRRQGLLVRRDHGPAALVARHGRLRLRVARGVERPRVRGSYSKRFFALRRGDRRRALDVQGERQDLGLADRHRDIVYFATLAGPHLRAERAHGQAALDVPRRQVHARRRRARDACSSSATARSMGWSRDEVRRHRRGRLHRLAARRRAQESGSRRRRRRLLHRLLRPGGEGGERARARRAPARSRRGAARPRRRRRRLPSRRAGRACAASATSSRSTCGATCSRRSACSRRARAAGVRVVFASSSSVYGEAEAYPTPEDDRAAADLAVRDHEARLRAPRARVRDRHSGSTRSCCATSRSTGRGSGRTCSSAASARRCSRGGTFEIYGTGEQSRSFTYVGDAVAATIAAMERAPSGGAVYNVGGGEEATMLEAIALLERLSGRTLDVQARRERRRATSRGRSADVARIRAALGWQPRDDARGRSRKDVVMGLG